MRSRLPTIALTLLVLLAGCSLGPGGATAPSEVDAPPGVEDGTLTNTSASLSAHTETLAESGFESDLRTNATVAQLGQIAQVERRQRTVVAPGATRHQYRATNPDAQFDIWGNRTVEVVRLQTGNQSQVRVNQNPTPVPVLTSETLLVRYLENETFTVTNVTQGDPTLYTLSSSEPPASEAAVPENATDVRDYRAVLVVDGAGRIHRFVATGTYTIEGQTGRFRLAYELVRTNGTRIDRPSWVDEALV